MTPEVALMVGDPSTLASSRVTIASTTEAAQKVLFAGHGWHLLEILGVFLTSIAGIWVAETLRNRPEHETRMLRRGPLLWVVALSGVAASGLHLRVMPEHFKESALYGSFFLVSAVLQIVFSGWLLARPARVLLAIGAVGNLTVALLWLFTRTVEIPLGPAAGAREPFGVLDVTCSSLEFLLAAAALIILLTSRPALPPVAEVGPADSLTSAFLKKTRQRTRTNINS
jgi:hypothetical protein